MKTARQNGTALLWAAGLGAVAWALRTPGEADTPVVDLTRRGFVRRDIVAPSGRMAVYEAGEGNPLLLLHGIGGGASSYYWRDLGPILARQYRVIAPDWVGWGASEHPARPLAFHDYVAQVASLFEDIGVPCDVVVQSLATGFVLAAPAAADVKRMVMIAPTGGRDFGEDAFSPFQRAVFSGLAKTPGLNRLFYRAFFHRRAAIEGWFRRNGFHDPSKIPQDVIDAGLFSARRSHARHGALSFLSGDLRYDLTPLLRDIPMPALMIWGEEERQIRPPLKRRLLQINPNIDVAQIAEARSNVELEKADEVADLIRGFLAPTPSR